MKMNKFNKRCILIYSFTSLFVLAMIGIPVSCAHNFTIYRKSLFDFVLPKTTFTEDEIIENLFIYASPGEYESATFVIYSPCDLNDVTVEYEDLVGAVGRIPKDNIDIRVVKVWEQAGLDVLDEGKFLVPELLLYDDSDILAGGFEQGIEFISGFEDNALFLDDSLSLHYPSEGNINLSTGTIDFWFKPDWDGNDNSKNREFFLLEGENGGFLKIISQKNGNLSGIYYDGEKSITCYGDDSELIVANMWHRITFTWNVPEQRIQLYFDSQTDFCDCNIEDFNDIDTAARFSIGGKTNYTDAVIDNFRIYDYEASAEEIVSIPLDQTRLLFSEDFESIEDVKNNGGILRSKPYVAPDISTVLRTDIPGRTSKQFWVTVHVPPDSRPGLYESRLRIRALNRLPKNLTLKVAVLPIKLREPKQWYIMFYRPTDPIRDLSDELLLKQMIDIREHGFNGLFLMGNEIEKQLDYAKSLSFDGPIIVHSNDYEEAIGLLEDRGYPPYLAGVDEPSITKHSLRHHIRKSFEIHQAGGMVFTSILKQTSDLLDDPDSRAYRLIDPNSDSQEMFVDLGITDERLDIANYHAELLDNDGGKGSDAVLWVYIQGLRDGSVEKLEKDETFYWQSWVEKPKLNRMQSGFFLWTTKLDGIAPYVYQHIILGRGDPFDDFDTDPGEGMFREMFTTYPSAQGPIPTTKWEALREGYDDLRYLTTLFYLLGKLRTVNPERAGEIETEINLELEKYGDPKDYKNLTGDDFQATRRKIIKYIWEVQLELYPGARHDIPTFLPF